MRIEPLVGEDYTVWLNDDDYRLLLNNAPSDRAHLTIRLCGEAGILVKNASQIQMDKIDVIDGKRFLRAPNIRSRRGPDFRDVYLPQSLYEEMRAYYRDHSGERDELLGVVKRTLQEDVKRAARATAESTGNTDFEYVSTRDLRRYYISKMLLEDRVNIRVVMELGGIDQIGSLEHYIPHPKREQVFEEIERITEVSTDG